MIVMSFPLNTAFSNQAALALAERGSLEEYWTCIHWRPGSVLDRLLPGALTRQLRRRALPPGVAAAARVRTSPWREAGRLLAARVPALSGRLTRHETGACSVDGVYRALDRRVARRLPQIAARARAVYAYEDGARDTFAAARSLGMKCLYDLPIGYWRAGREIYEEEAAREPAWAATLTGRGDSPAKLARKDAELLAADAIFTASTFTRRTLALAPDVRCPVHVVPYAAPPALAALPATPPSQKLRVLFAGSLGQRKGLSYLLAAAGRLAGHVELTLLGAKTVADCPALDAATRAHRWIPSLPHAEVLAEMERHDVLVFPSLFEGFGLVILEAMSRGLPVIATAHTAAPDLYTDGQEGFIVPIRSADAIVEKLERLIREPTLLRAMKSAALARARTHRWDTYRAGLAAGIRRTLGDLPPPC